jgi:hypothetical protein
MSFYEINDDDLSSFNINNDNLTPSTNIHELLASKFEILNSNGQLLLQYYSKSNKTNSRKRKRIISTSNMNKIDENMSDSSDCNDESTRKEETKSTKTIIDKPIYDFDPLIEKQYLKQKMIVSNKYNSRLTHHRKKSSVDNNDLTTSLIYCLFDLIVFMFILFILYIFQLIQK